MLFLLVLAVAPLATARALVLAQHGRAGVTIVCAADAPASEQTAARELADYLGRISGAKFAVVPETKATGPGSRVFVGHTAFSRAQKLLSTNLAPEAWIVRSVGRDLVIAGGAPRGTLYGVYHFLEDSLGVHWWNPFEESVPSRTTLRIGRLNQHGQPAIPYRDIYMLYGQDGGRFAARNRLNRDGDARIAAGYGGCLDYGPPYHVHTFYAYFPPKEFFATHPEWYALSSGQRLRENAQLCLTNPDLRKAFLAKLRENIERSWAAARVAGEPPPLVFSISQNDCLNPCQCDNCQTLARSEESECGPLLDLVNYLADGIQAEYPAVFLDTLAYQYTQKVPRHIRPRDNVIVRLCDTDSDPTRPITDPANTAFREHVTRWSEVARHLRIWDYAVTYANPVGMPMPTAQTFGPDYQFYRAHHVEGVFTELEFEILADLRDLKVWIMMKQLENPDADYAQLLRTFTDGFYGSAGAYVRQYLAALEQETRLRRTRCDWNSTPTSLTYLNLGFIRRAQAQFDQAEKAVRSDATLLRRVRHARLPLDRATLAVHSRLTAEWIRQGQPPAGPPPDRESTAQRALDTWMAQAKLRLPASAQESEQRHAEAELHRYTAFSPNAALPAQFREVPRNRIYDFPATLTRNWGDIVKVVKDPEAETGLANKLDLTADNVPDAEKYVLPMSWGLYGVAEKRGIGSRVIQAADIPGPGYHWYKLGTYPIASGYYVYFFWSWIIQAEVDNVCDPAKPEQPFEIWARIKFEGPRFPHAQPNGRDAIYVERLLLIKPDN